MTNNEIKRNLKKAHKLLIDCDFAIVELNKNENKFNYNTDSELADLADGISLRAKSLEFNIYSDFE